MPALEVVGLVSILVAFASAVMIGADILARGRQIMGIMNVVWPVTALHWGPASLWGYFHIGAKMRRQPGQSGHGAAEGEQAITWQMIAVSDSHCGAGCVLGDIAGEFIVFGTGWKIAGQTLFASYAVDFIIAWALGILFQYFAIAPMRGLGVRQGVKAAIKADTLSIASFEVGLFGWMAIVNFVLFSPPLRANQWAFWMMMQIGMTLGFFTASPVNRWLLEKGWKERMG